MAERVRARVVIAGVVQGVSFRYYTTEEARRLGVAGFVRNLDDGRVEAEAEGAREAVERLVAWCRHGPPAATVERVDVEWLTPSGDQGAFGVRH